MIGVILLMIWAGTSAYGLVKHNEESINILSFMCVFQNIILVVASPYINNMVFTLFILIKEAYVWALIILGFLKKKKIGYFDMGCLLCVLGVVCFACVNNSGSFSGTLVSIRQLYLPFVFVLLGSAVIKTQKQIDGVLKFYVILMLISVLFGLIEQVFLKDQFWIDIGFSSYARLKGIESGLSFDTKVHGAFYTWDLGFRYRRMVSFMAEPVILGQLFAFALIISMLYKNIFDNRKVKIMAIFLLLMGLILAMAKGGIIIALFAFAFSLGKIYKDKRISYIAKMGFMVILIVGVAYVFRPGSTSNGAFHLAGLTENMINLPQYLFGRGIGSVGNLGYSYGGRTLIANGESFIGAVIGQMGIIGIGLFSWFYTELSKRIKCSANGELYGIGNIVLYLNYGLLITSFVNNTAISFTSCFIVFLISGGLCRVQAIKSNSYDYFSMEINHKGREAVLCQR